MADIAGKNNVYTVQKLEGEVLCENHRSFNAIRIKTFDTSNFVSFPENP